MKSLATSFKGFVAMMLCILVCGIAPAVAQVTLAPRTNHHAVQSPAMRSLTSDATVSMGCTDQVGFTLGTPANTTDWGYSTPDDYTIGAEFYNGTYYLATYPSGYLIAMDPTTHAANIINTSGVNDVAYNPADGQFYGFDLEGATLYTVDPSTGNTTFVVTINSENVILAFTITNDGRFLMIDSGEDAISELNTTTGDLTVLISAGFDVNYIQDISMDRETNTPYWAAYNATAEESQLYSIDLDNNTITLIGNFEDEVSGFAVASFSVADALRPAAPADFTAVPAADHTLSASLSWTNPTVDLGGNDLEELTSVELFRNGTLLYSFANPTIGGAMTYTDNTIPADGTYHYSIYGVNAAGNGAAATATALVGNMCELTLEMVDSWGDGWNGAAIEIYDNTNTLVGSYTCSGTGGTELVPLAVGTYTFNWVGGNYDSECSFTITNSFGILVYQSEGTPSAGTFLTYNNTCTPPTYYTVSGTITVAATNTPIANANVAISGLNGGMVTTDAAGYYEKDSIVEAFPYSIVVNATGYNNASTAFTGIFSDTTINFAMTAPGLQVTYAAPIDVTTTQGLDTQFSPITVANTGDGNLTWSTGVEFVRGRSEENTAANYNFTTAQRAKSLSTADLNSTIATIVGEPTRAAWDLLSTMNATSAGQQGIATDGNYIYTCSWQTTPTSGYTFVKYDLDGNMIEGFDIAGVSGCRDLTYDGTYFYVGASSSSLYQLDLANHTLVSTINTQVSAIRHCSYDPENDGFWVGNWSDLYLIDRTGNILVTGPTTIESAYGSAYDNYTAGGPFLWLFTQANEGSVFVQYDIANNALTNTTVDISTINSDVTGTAGGAFSTADLVPGKFVIMANSQQDPNIINVFDIADAGWLSVTPGSGQIAAGGQSTDITLNFNGNNPMGDYYANLTITTNNPYVGAEVIPVTFHIIAPDCDAPNNLQVVPTDYTYMALTWEAPENTTDFVEYRLYKNGNVHEFATTTETSYNDTVAPGTYCYFVKAYYTDGTTQCLSLASDTVCGELLHAPMLTANPTALTLSGIAGSPSSPATSDVEAYTLDADIAVEVTAPFEVSVDGATYATTATIAVNTNHVEEVLYVRIAADAAAGSHTGTVTLTSGDLTATINLNGQVFDCSEGATLPFTEGFEAELVECWTNIDNDGDGYTWQLMTDYADYAHSGSGLYTSASWVSGGGALNPDNWLITPKLAIPEEGAHLEFWVAPQDPSYPQEHYQVLVSTTGTNISDFNTVLIDETLSSTVWVKKSWDLDFANQNIYIAFVHNDCSDLFRLNLDDINITAGLTGVEENEMSNINVYPNPATNVINVSAQGFEQYQLVNMLGQTVISNNLVNGNAQINVSELSNGVYFVRLINGSEVETVKVIKK